ncbi:unnamed protein product [Leptidea sinapis]|uniref:DUF7027 domain-containing protein n=1 Tax=Leptidea sinapis TaxID=189913 RepID=A0A5E4PZV3_9NEOP|nr:unnamed protein product [Leptidea sinapis]
MCLPVSNCCLCISLSVGAKIVAVLSLIVSTCTVLVYGAAAMLPPSSVRETRRISYAAIALAAGIKLLMSFFMVYGAFKKRPKLLLPWLLTAWFYSLVLIGLSLFGTVLMALQYVRDLDTSAEVSTMVAVYFVYAIVLYYFASVVNSRRNEMNRDVFTYTGHHLVGHRVLPKHYYS